MIFKEVSPNEIDGIWPLVENGIKKALETSNGEASVEDTKEGLKAGRTNLIILDSGYGYSGLVIFLCQFPQYRIARILLMFGKNIHTGKELEDRLDDWLREKGCKYIEAWVATKSRARLFKRRGYEPTYQIIRKEL